MTMSPANDLSSQKTRSTKVVAWPIATFVLSLVLTFAATLLVAHLESKTERAVFANEVADAQEQIQQRMAGYFALLRATAGMLSRNEPVSPEEFRVFVERLRLPEYYAGTQGIGYTARFGHVSVAEATARAHALGWTDIEVWPDEPRDEVHAIVMLEPRDARNERARGYDMRTETTRRTAMDRARDEGRVAMSGKVTLVQEFGATKQLGFLLYSPVFEGGKIPSTVEERRAKLKGFAYAPLRAGDLFAGVFERAQLGVAFELFDGDTVDESALLSSHGRPTRNGAQIEKLELAGRTWTLRFAHDGASVHSVRSVPLAIVVAVLGTLLSVVVLVVVFAREAARERELSATAAALASEEVVRFMQTFIGILGHDLRSPLNAIIMSSQWMLKRNGLDDETRQTLSRTLASGRRMSRMIQQILDLTRMRLGGGIFVTRQQMQLGNIVRDIVDETMRGKPGSHIELETSGDLTGSWDADRLAQVFTNLVGNAAQYGSGGRVSVVVDGTEPSRVTTTIHNAGAIPASRVPHLFEPFRGTRESTLVGKSSAGLGLGLYIARSIVEAHGGSLVVSSSEERGTTFTVVLPRESAVAHEVDEAEGGQSSQTRIAGTNSTGADLTWCAR